jgi:hypothetical protein
MRRMQLRVLLGVRLLYDMKDEEAKNHNFEVCGCINFLVTNMFMYLLTYHLSWSFERSFLCLVISQALSHGHSAMKMTRTMHYFQYSVHC